MSAAGAVCAPGQAATVSLDVLMSRLGTPAMPAPVRSEWGDVCRQLVEDLPINVVLQDMGTPSHGE